MESFIHERDSLAHPAPRLLTSRLRWRQNPLTQLYRISFSGSAVNSFEEKRSMEWSARRRGDSTVVRSLVIMYFLPPEFGFLSITIITIRTGDRAPFCRVSEALGCEHVDGRHGEIFIRCAARAGLVYHRTRPRRRRGPSNVAELRSCRIRCNPNTWGPKPSTVAYEQYPPQANSIESERVPEPRKEWQ